ncbi:GNAT family N-acetyltransferase [Bacillus sp. EB106-08-02-XG196]|jgi:ribosomal protein S18 acetylase RimI-like enzyme|uniref:GNAT family N-acetyltransferase n=1 Tax=Bacillus sp. EB106-08-02-XG196 TaxID=2737049 RepID=UPI0015C42427|nr:GNAT family N-acetyltransferase [Bacillus sp. EB106-08-02-XG196]NWQ43193.1 GNAT family N-acetyltransferase [Bacillus sp. EB106-08-02-XG196]
MSIRKATINELDSLTELFDSYRVFYKQDSDIEAAKSFLKERLLNEDSVVFIAYDESNPIGFVQLYPTFSSVSMKRSWVLNDLYVNASARKKGFGEKLIQKAIEFAEETGAKGLALETGQDNIAAQRLYEKIGFKKESNYFYYFSI